jgi:hypothetical protein
VEHIGADGEFDSLFKRTAQGGFWFIAGGLARQITPMNHQED